jgi:hypothetical protein
MKEGKMTQRVGFGLLLLTVLLSVPVTGQTPAPDRWQPPPTSDGQPDMRGFWRNGTTFQAAAAFSLEGDHSRWPEEFVISDLTPLAVPGSPPITATYVVEPADGKIPYQPWAAEKRKEFIANAMAPTKLEHIDPHARAWLDGVPRNNHVPGEIQIVQVPGYVLFLYSSNHAYRVIPLDGRPHVGDSIKLFMGDSRGHWEGNTLVVDVTNQNDRTWLDWLSFHGDRLHVVERWTLVSPDRIDFTATFEDPSMFTRPWSIAYRFNRHKEDGYEIWEDARHEGERDAELTLRGGGFKPEGRDK